MSTPPPITVLLVDDEEHLLLSLSDHLKHEGFNVITANSGESALAQLEAINPALIILDISMPGMGGIGFLRRITHEDGTTRYPVLVLTARASMKEFFGSVQVDGFLEKPCDETELVAKIREITASYQIASEKQSRTKRRILLAEDDSVTAMLITSALETAGFEVVLSKEGPDVLEQAVVSRPDLFLLKEVVSGLNGSVIATMLQVMPSARATPVIVYDESRSSLKGAARGLPAAKNVRTVLYTANPDSLKDAVECALQ